ncbi:unnamed protein product [Dibothriocephalus latus]|uniref:Uncharacterized protein n=1 Tax=Dibothriocephalus latus TaxID=60516 RepID=A0A3P7M949_DIBLA|nr:unnamed protein product [Dibothriocephalus latus]
MLKIELMYALSFFLKELISWIVLAADMIMRAPREPRSCSPETAALYQAEARRLAAYPSARIPDANSLPVIDRYDWPAPPSPAVVMIDRRKCNYVHAFFLCLVPPPPPPPPHFISCSTSSCILPPYFKAQYTTSHSCTSYNPHSLFSLPPLPDAFRVPFASASPSPTSSSPM